MRRFRRKLIPALMVAFYIGMTTPAAADPISDAIVAILATVSITVTAAEVTTFLILSAISIGLGFLERALTPKPKTGAGTINGVTGTIQTGGQIPRSFIFGRYATAGSLVYVNTWGQDGKTPNAYLTQVIALSDLPANALESTFYVNSVPATYGTTTPDPNYGYPVPEYTTGGQTYLWVKFYDGTQSSVDSFLNSTFGSDPNYPYDSNRVGHGVAYVVVTARLNSQYFSSFPKFVFVLQGAKLYDQRQDSTAGGSGSQRFSDQTTWTFTENPAVIMNNILRGITYAGTWMYGLQNMTASRVPSDSWFAAMNECDALVAKYGGGTMIQFRCGGELAVNLQPADVIGQLTQACNARLAEVGGTYKILVGAVGASVLSFTDSNIIIDVEQKYTPNPSLSTIINGVTSRYPEPAQAWATTDAPPRYDSSLETIDGQRLITNVDYPLVEYLEQVQRLQTATVQEARKWRTHTFVLPPECWVLEPNDTVSYTSTRNGYTSKLFRVDSISDLDNCDNQVTLIECDPADYNWTPSSQYIPKVDGALTIASYGPASQSLGGFAVSATTITGANGTQRAAIHITWAVDVDDVNGVDYEIELQSDSSLVIAGETGRWDLGYINVATNILPNTAYKVRCRYTSASGRQFTWTSFLSVTTGNVLLVSADIADALITWAKFAAGLTPIQQVSSLGSAIQGTVANPAYAVLDTNGLLYKSTGSGWSTVVNTTDLTGQISTTQITDGSVTTPKVAALNIVASLIASANIQARHMDVDSVTAGTVDVGAIQATNEIVNNILVTGQLVANAVTNNTAASNNSGDTTLNVVCSGGPILILSMIDAGSGTFGNFDLQRSGSSILPIGAGTGIDAFSTATVLAIDNPGVGTFTYNTASSSGTARSVIAALELKR